MSVGVDWRGLTQRGQAALLSGDANTAQQLARRARELAPGQPEVLLLHANASLKLEDYTAAIGDLRHLCQLHPQAQALSAPLATALNNRGSRQRRNGALEPALADFIEALLIDPQQAQAGFNLALTHFQLGDRAAALVALQDHLQCQPDDVEAQLKQIHWQPEQALSDSVQFERLLQRAAELELPELERISCAARLDKSGVLSKTLSTLPDESREAVIWRSAEHLRNHNLPLAAQRISAKGDSPRCLLGAAQSVPQFITDSALIDEQRERSSQALTELAIDWPQRWQRQPPASLEKVGFSAFYLAYQGRSDRDFNAQTGDLLCSAAASVPVAREQALEKPKPRRIALVSSRWRDCTVASYFGCWIKWLSDAGFETVLCALGAADQETQRLAANADHYLALSGSLDDITRQLRQLRAALIIYPDIGMDAEISALAALRLAPLQAAAWGHPVSTGLPTIDTYFSCAEMEPADAQNEYRESLRLLPGLGVDFRRPPVVPTSSRQQLGLPDQPLLLAPQSLFKLHPDNDAIYAAVLEALPTARLLLFDLFPHLRAAMVSRLEKSGCDVSRLHWLPPMSRQRYLQLNANCDLMLDSLHFSGGNASLDALQTGLPVLSCPGAFMRGRQTAAMLKRMGLDGELCAATPEAMAALAVETIRSKASHELRPLILERREQLFAADAARLALIEHLEGMLSSSG